MGTLYHLTNDRVEFTFNMRTNFLLAFLLVLGTVQAHPSNGRQRFARQEAPEEETTLESKPETEDVMMKDDMPAEVEAENEVQDNKVQVKVEEASTTTTKAPIRLAPLGVTLRTATTTTTTTTRRTTTQSPTTTTKRPEEQADPGLLGRLGNFITGGVNTLAASTVGGNL